MVAGPSRSGVRRIVPAQLSSAALGSPLAAGVAPWLDSYITYSQVCTRCLYKLSCGAALWLLSAATEMLALGEKRGQSRLIF